MNSLRVRISVSVSLFLVCVASRGATAVNTEFRLALGDTVQERRTTSVNWPAVALVKAKVPVTATPVSESDAPSVPAPIVTTVSGPKKFKVLVDVGHGGHDFGAPGHSGVLEKEICLRIAANVKARLERLANLHDFPLEVRLSREDDTFIPLRERVRIANTWSADLFVSIHANSSPVPRARGFEVYFLANEASDADASRIAKTENGENASTPLSQGVLSILSDLKTNEHILESSRFAESIYGSLSESLRPNGKGVRQAPFAVLSGTQMPALLIEVGYVTNLDEARALKRTTYQYRIANGISEGVLAFALQMRRLGKLSIHIGRHRTT